MKFQYNEWKWSLASNQSLAIFLTLYGNLFGGVVLIVMVWVLFKVGFPEGWLLLFIIGFLLYWIVMWNFQTFSRLLRCSNLELEHDRLILHLFPQWAIRINLFDLKSVKIQQSAVPKNRTFGADLGFKMQVFFISSPSLPWYFQMVGQFAHKSLKGRGFFITSQHTDYELFLDQMRQYEGV